MNTALSIVAALGGLVVFIGAVVAVIRAITRQVTATEQNTIATAANTEAIRHLEDKVDTLDRTVFIHGEKITSQAAQIDGLKNAINGRSR